MDAKTLAALLAATWIRGIRSIAIGALLFAGQAAAASITWSGSTLVGDGTADISLTGSLVEAHNAGYNPPAMTAGGVLFDNVEINPLGFQFSGANPLNITGDASFDGLLDTASYWYGTVALTIDGLTDGNSYLVQFFVTDSRVYGQPRTVTVSDGTNSLTSGFIDAGFAFTGMFTASGSTQDVLFSGLASENVPYLNAWQLRDVTAVPEPSIIIVLAIGLAVLGLARRRKLR